MEQEEKRGKKKPHHDIKENEDHIKENEDLHFLLCHGD